MNSFIGANTALVVLLSIVVMVAICTIVGLIYFARKQWAREKEVDPIQQHKLHQRLEQVTEQAQHAEERISQRTA